MTDKTWKHQTWNEQKWKYYERVRAQGNNCKKVQRKEKQDSFRSKTAIGEKKQWCQQAIQCKFWNRFQILPSSGIASDTWGRVSATKLRKTVKDNRMVTPET